MISKKDKMIVKAINKSKGSPVDIESVYRYQCVAKAKGSNRDFPHGEIHAVKDTHSDEYWKFICTVEEFKQCVKEMSEAKWMQKPIEELMLSAREEAEIRYAKHKQIGDLLEVYQSEFNAGINLFRLLKKMQDNGDLAEILLGLEK
jgi:hypothetical protein